MLTDFLENDDHSLGYCEAKLRGTFVKDLTNNSPVLVNSVGKKTTLCSDYRGELKEYLNSNLEVYDLPLGYSSVKGMDGLVYVSKIPVRRVWRQGLTPNHLFYTRGDKIFKLNIKSNTDMFPILGQTFNPEYKGIVDDAKHKIISPKLMVCSKGKAYYLGVKVGSANFINGSINLAKEFFFLEEEINGGLR